MKHIIVGTAGHIDHGKTALVKALTGIDADRLKEEQERGITIDIGFADLAIGDTRFGFVDVPGHERFVKNMLAGAHGIDLVMLVVAADESIMPQTREHFDICRLLHVKSGLVALTKSDIVDADLQELAQAEVADFVHGSFLGDAPIIAVSSRTGEGIDELKAALVELAATVEAKVTSAVPGCRWIAHSQSEASARSLRVRSSPASSRSGMRWKSCPAACEAASAIFRSTAATRNRLWPGSARR